MIRRFHGFFEKEEQVLQAASQARSEGIKIVDLKAPYPLPGANQFLDLHRSRLPWFCFSLGLLGAAAKIWFEFWTTAVDWPINVGGKPWNSLPAFAPVTFEVMVLVAGLSTILAFFVSRRLFPGKKVSLASAVGRFVLTLEIDGSFPGFSRVREILHDNQAVEIVDDEGGVT